MMTNHPFQIVLTTCPDSDSAQRIADALVGERLAACVNILPVMQSVYIWHGQIERGAEHLLVIKSRSDSYERIQARILQLHPYELPEVITVPVTGGFNDYLSWLDNPDNR